MGLMNAPMHNAANAQQITSQGHIMHLIDAPSIR